MKLKLVRSHGTKGFTEGRLYINDVFECFTVEDQERDSKVMGLTAIPKGLYKVIMSLSNRFKKVLPEILNVPGFTGVRIHSGNTSKHTEGCIIVGALNDKADDDFVGSSVLAMSRLTPKLAKAFKAGEEISLEIL